MSRSGQSDARGYTRAFLVATVAALLADAALQLGLEAVRVARDGGSAPWWITAHLIERGRWVVFAALLAWLAPRLVGIDDSALAAASQPEAWRRVALAVVAVPLLWILATWMVTAVRFTLLGSWDTDGRAFGSPDYYRAILMDLAPWVVAAAALWLARRHLP